MKCYIITKAVLKRFRAHKLVDIYDWIPTYVCHTTNQADSLLSIGIPARRVVVSGVPMNFQGAALQREFVAKQIMPIDEWSIWLDDNVEKITGLESIYSIEKLDYSGKSNTYRKLFTNVLSKEDLQYHITTTINKAEEHNTIYTGSSLEDNYFYRANKWSLYSYCRTQFAMYKNDGSTWLPFRTMGITEDIYKSIDVIARYGSCIVNRHIHAVKPMFEEGGIGSFENRIPQLQHECEELMNIYPGLLRYKNNGTKYGVDSAENFHLAIAKRGQVSIDRWRKEHGYL